MEGKELYHDDDENNKNEGQEPEEDDFGLPEIDSEPEGYEQEETPDESSYTSSYEDTYSSAYSDSETDYTSQYSSTPEAEDEYAYDPSTNVEETSYEEEYLRGLESSDEEGGYEGEEEGEDDENRYERTYLEEEEGGSKAWIWILVVVFILGGGAAIWYFFFYNSGHEQRPVTIEKPKIIPKDTAKSMEDSMAFKPEPVREKPVEQNTGQVTQLAERTGKYYVVIASFIDDDLAMDYGNKLLKEGVSTYLLAPKGSKKFFRLAKGEYASLEDATLASESLKSQFGEEIWVMKY